MTPSPPLPTGLVADASVLIDYLAAEVPGKEALQLVVCYIAPVYVPGPVLEEVHGMTEAETGRLGITVHEPGFDEVTEAAAGEGGLSFQDRLCYIVARNQGWHCFSNDTALRNACRRMGVSCMWGLEAMRYLVRDKHLTPAKADQAATRMVEVNPLLTRQLLRRFRKQIGR